MSAWLATRLVRALLTAAGVVLVVFLLVRVVPGDPVLAILGEQSSPEDQDALRHTLHLDRSLPEQLALFVRDVADGSLGRSFRQRDLTVASRIAAVMPDTAELALASLLVAWLLAIPLGTLAAARRGSAWDGAARTLAVLGVALPTIWLGPLLVLLFAVELRVLPMPGDDAAGLVALVLPAVTLGAALAAILTRQTRASMIEVLSEPYIVAARARGLSSARVTLRHALRNALLPVLTVGGAQLGALLSGAVVAERIFERPGLGSLFLDAFAARDIPVVQGCVLVIALVYVSVNLLVDVTYGLVDPRARVEG